jgi:hypothetical protein
LISELQAVEAALAGVASGGVHLLQVATPGGELPKLPYLLIEPQVGVPRFEPSLDGEDGELDFRVRLKAVAANSTSSLIVLRNARARLVNGGRRGALPVAGRTCEIEYERHETDFIDTQTALPSTTRSVALSIDTYRLISQPA